MGSIVSFLMIAGFAFMICAFIAFSCVYVWLEIILMMIVVPITLAFMFVIDIFKFKKE